MVDRFKSMTDLMSQTIEGVDWEIITKEAAKPTIITAVHGGAIERGTTELALLMSERGEYDFYTFKGVRRNKNNELHVTSRHFDEPKLLNMVENNQCAISVHGCMGQQPEVYIGGRDEELIERIKVQLNQMNIVVKDAPGHISGKHTDNFVNCCQNDAGVQLELTVALRKSFFKNNKFNLHDREHRDNWSPLLYQFTDVVISAVDNG
ncbi:hypothetical protein BU063_02745 [Staphylococcus succinus]|uniref:poly-gamma-glutamate hydrolase family protein n=1 Tax=Staphylococcus succinus TaxID=61015 RepID=UPI000E69B781|nr:poly-gamma-glutamate hydrolase family protein [Staphylococcus succinus]RIN33008.1 hypothetical protein BU063_02745 [Staphylococcus succinus]